jgi:hypothetical protein
MKLKSVIAASVFEVAPVVCDKDESGVYLIGSTRHGWYKIGQSSTVTRVRGYRSCPFVIDTKLVWSVPTGQSRAIERGLHALVESKRIRANGGYSEWFRLAVRDIHLIQDHMRVCVYFVNSSPVSWITHSYPITPIRYPFAVRTPRAGLRRCYSACRVQPNEIVKWEIIVISDAKWTAARGVQNICT